MRARLYDGRAVLNLEVLAFHDHFHPVQCVRVGNPLFVVTYRFQIAPDDLLTARFLHNLVIRDRGGNLVDPHVGRRFVYRFACDAFDHAFDNREHLHVAVVVDGRRAVSVKMEGINLVEILEVNGCRFVSHVQRVLNRHVPYREGLKFRVARAPPEPFFVVQLVQAGRKFTRPRPWRGHNHDGLGCFYVRVAPIAFRWSPRRAGSPQSARACRCGCRAY